MKVDLTPSFGFYDIDRTYIETLRSKDNHVPNCDYEDYDRARKFYCGPITTQYGINYFVPVSSQKDKNMYIVGSAANGVREYYGIEMKDNQGNSIGSLNFKFMIPCVHPCFLTPHELTGHSIIENEFCQKNKLFIQKLANDTFVNIESNDYPSLTQTSVNFAEAESAGWEYYDKMMNSKLTNKISQCDRVINSSRSQPQSSDFSDKSLGE